MNIEQVLPMFSFGKGGGPHQNQSKYFREIDVRMLQKLSKMIPRIEIFNGFKVSISRPV